MWRGYAIKLEELGDLNHFITPLISFNRTKTNLYLVYTLFQEELFLIISIKAKITSLEIYSSIGETALENWSKKQVSPQFLNFPSVLQKNMFASLCNQSNRLMHTDLLTFQDLANNNEKIKTVHKINLKKAMFICNVYKHIKYSISGF